MNPRLPMVRRSRTPAIHPPGFMQFLVATQGALGLVTVRGQESTAQAIHTGAGLYYGITWDQYRYYVVARGAPTNLLSFSRGPSGYAEPKDMPSPITTVYDQGIPSPHQAHYNGRLWIADTQTCSLLNYDPSTNLWGNAVTWGGNRDSHLNSVWGIGDLWIAEHTRENPYKYLRRFMPGRLTGDMEEVLRITLHLPELHQGRLQSGIHNVYRELDKVYTLGAINVITVDLVSAQVEVRPLEEVTPGSHYLRGLSRILNNWWESDAEEGDDYFIVGRSNSQTRGDRGHGSSALLCFNRDWRLLAKWDLPENWGQVMEVRALTHADRAHNGLTPPHLRLGQHWGFKWE